MKEEEKHTHNTKIIIILLLTFSSINMIQEIDRILNNTITYITIIPVNNNYYLII